MNEKQIQVMFTALQAQRNVAQDQVVELIGKLSQLEEELMKYKAKEEAKKVPNKVTK